MTAVLWLCRFTLPLRTCRTLARRARWPRQAPRAAVVLWQAIGIAGRSAAIGFGVSVTVMPAHAGLLEGISPCPSSDSRSPAPRARDQRCTRPIAGHRRLLRAGHRLGDNGPAHHIRSSAAPPPSRSGQSDGSGKPNLYVLDDPRVAAYCLPGLSTTHRSECRGAGLLTDDEIGAVVAHEEGHAHGHHGVVMLPFASMDSLLRWMPYARHARTEVAVLLEMAADDFAVRSNHLGAACRSPHRNGGTSGASPTCAFSRQLHGGHRPGPSPS